jgi:hypothetical protein
METSQYWRSGRHATSNFERLLHQFRLIPTYSKLKKCFWGLDSECPSHTFNLSA